MTTPATATGLAELALAGLGSSAHVIVTKGGEVVADETTGMGPDARYILFSLSKPLTVLALLTLVDAGEIGLDTTVASILPAFAQGGKATVTLAEVLSHSAGFPIHLAPEDGGEPLAIADFADWDRAVELICRMPMVPAWRGLGIYHGLSMSIVARVAEVVSGRDFDTFCREALFAPLGMEQTTFGLPEAASGFATGLAGAHAAGWDEPMLRRAIVPAGNAWSTAGDVARLFAMLRAGGVVEGRRVLSESIIAEATRCHVRSVNAVWGMGLGFFVGDAGPVFARGTRGAIRAFGHSGAMGTQAFHDPENDITIVALTNSCDTQEASDARFNRFCDEVYDRFLPA